MERRTKHRILGILVITGMAIILFPWFKVSKELAPEAALIQSPPFPEKTDVATSEVVSPPIANQPEKIPPLMMPIMKPVAIEEKNAVTPAVEVHKQQALTSEQMAAKSNLRVQESAWVVQVGSFNKQDNARSLIKRLHAKGYHAFIQQSSNTSNNNVRVLVGPEKDMKLAQALVKRLQNEMKLSGIIRRNQPLN